ncbi:hypothetical protein AALO_G00038960 [Alosa alosa]|uniref:Uncharacterized protein n=2 Tax=Alosa TaxID=34772 RepID=A0AAV6HAH3_9TELE|nr:uncharacterized protein si:ch211-218d20.15 isoform X1 [Alosa sapidissima]XP_048095636.1 uncharacterized protein si:ch211-218d20.15 [Alosa alosa]KAG5283157.1 hypothetical protein AALO_G00038960 [Alosa alosa]
MAVCLTEPLCKPCMYHVKFKVELHVKKSLLPIHLSCEQVGLEMLCLCGQLDLLIRAQVHQFQEQLKRNSSPMESYALQRQGAEIIEQMHQCLEHLPKPAPELEDYLDIVGLSTMFPRVEIFVIHGSPVDMLEKPALDGYFPHIGRLNQLLVLCQQLEDDVQHLGSHKYIAHQLSVIYQVLSSLKGILPLAGIRKDIEAHFKEIKKALVPEEGSKLDPQLPSHHINWILEVTQTLVSTVSSLPEELTEDLNQVMAFVSKLK